MLLLDSSAYRILNYRILEQLIRNVTIITACILFILQISDWRFPYKRSFHPVCLHDDRTVASVTLQNCEEGVEPGTERYEYLEALSCRCMVCKSSEASCEGLRYRGQRSGPFLGGGR